MPQGKAENERNAKAYKLYAATKRKDLVPPVTYTNATTTGLYRGHAMASPRGNADDHFQHHTRGLGAQIVRAV